MTEIVNYLSVVAVPMIILLIIVYGLLEKKKVFDLFIKGAKDGIDVVVRIFPTLIGIFLAVGFLRTSGVLDLIMKIICPITYMLKIPSEVIPLMIIRPISGSASIAVATDIMKAVGVDSNIRINCINNYGIYRDYILYNCNLYKCCWNKKNEICFSSSINS